MGRVSIAISLVPDGDKHFHLNVTAHYFGSVVRGTACLPEIRYRMALLACRHLETRDSDFLANTLLKILDCYHVTPKVRVSHRWTSKELLTLC